MRKLFYTLSMSFLFFGCSTDDNLKDISSSVGESTGLELLSVNQKAIRKYIKSKKQKTRSSQESKLIPHIVNGDTVCYIVNYGNGWEVFSNDLRIPMVLMSSEDGCFYPGFTDNPTFDAFFDTTSEILSALKSEEHVGTDSIDSSWNPYITLMSNVIPSDDPEYVYVYDIVKSEATYSDVEYTPKGGRLNTKWHQGRPYYYFIPEIYDESDGSYKNGAVGCIGITASQYLYWHHKYFGTPVSTVDSATYNESSRSYTFSGNSSTVWDDFYDESKDSRMLWYFNEIKPTAIFIGYIAQKTKTRFGISGSSSNSSNMVSVLNELLNDSYRSADGNINNIKKILSAGYPVISTTYGGEYIKKNKDGTTTKHGFDHAYIIDYAYAQYWDSKNYWAYKKIPVGDDTEEAPDWNPEGLTIEELEEYYGHLDITYSSTSYYNVKMNWGWGDSYDDVLINYQLPTLIFGDSQISFDVNKPEIFHSSKITL